MAWKGLPDIDSIRPLDETDQAVLDDLRTVLERHGALERFGVTLLHSHFDVRRDELLVERVDPEARTLTTRPERATDSSGTLWPTSFRLDEPGGVPITFTFCWRPKGSDNHAR